VKRRAAVLVADDHAVVAEALAASLARWFQVVGTVTNLTRLDGEIAVKAPDVVLLDLEFGKTSALTILAGLVDRYPATKFVILTAFSEPVLADAALRAGAVAYVVKESAASELRVAIDEAVAGRTYLTPLMQVRGAGGATALPGATGVTLSDRQRSILGLLRQGLTYRNIAGRLRISTKTVEYHIDMLGRRLGVSGKAQLIRWSEQFFRDEP
jgi:DNA-binding NarL/FixJ family response regulator